MRVRIIRPWLGQLKQQQSLSPCLLLRRSFWCSKPWFWASPCRVGTPGLNCFCPDDCDGGKKVIFLWQCFECHRIDFQTSYPTGWKTSPPSLSFEDSLGFSLLLQAVGPQRWWPSQHPCQWWEQGGWTRNFWICQLGFMTRIRVIFYGLVKKVTIVWSKQFPEG